MATIPIGIRLVNHKTGEIYAESVINNFTTTQFEHKEKLYRWIDCICRAYDKGEKLPMLQIAFHEYPQEPTIF